MQAKEVVVSKTKSQVIVGTFDIVKTVCVVARSLIGTVKAFDYLLERSVFGRDSIVVGKFNDLGDFEGKVLAKIYARILARQAGRCCNRQQ